MFSRFSFFNIAYAAALNWDMPDLVELEGEFIWGAYAFFMDFN